MNIQLVDSETEIWIDEEVEKLLERFAEVGTPLRGGLSIAKLVKAAYIRGINSTKEPLLPCPFCGKTMQITEDTIYPSGTVWLYNEDLQCRTYHGIHDIPNGNICWQINCCEHEGGCGASISGDSRQETIEKWNKRV